MNTVCGMKVISHPLISATRPRMTLSEKVTVSDEFRREFNAWLLEVFGEERFVVVVSGKTIMANYENVAIIRNLSVNDFQRDVTSV